MSVLSVFVIFLPMKKVANKAATELFIVSACWGPLNTINRYNF